MDLHNKLTQESIEWHNKHIAKRKDIPTDIMKKPKIGTDAYWDWIKLQDKLHQEQQQRDLEDKEPLEDLPINEEIILKHKSDNLIPADVEVTLNDVLFDKDIISYDEWQKFKDNG